MVENTEKILERLDRIETILKPFRDLKPYEPPKTKIDILIERIFNYLCGIGVLTVFTLMIIALVKVVLFNL